MAKGLTLLNRFCVSPDFAWMEKIRGDLQMLTHKRTDLYEVVSKFKADE